MLAELEGSGSATAAPHFERAAPPGGSAPQVAAEQDAGQGVDGTMIRLMAIMQSMEQAE